MSIKPLKPYDWRKYLSDLPNGADAHYGPQLFHFITKSKPYIENPSAVEFYNHYLTSAKRLRSDAEVLKFSSEAVKISNGAYLEMGVCTGKTINFIAALNPHNMIHGFDSFEGLPEDWRSGDLGWKKGTLSLKDTNNIPPVLHNVRLYKGLFNETLPLFKENILRDSPIAFLHIDCDLYSSTKEVFEILGSNIKPGTIIVFDELYNFPEYEEHEWKAFQEFLSKFSFKAEYIAFNENHEQVTVRIN